MGRWSTRICLTCWLPFFGIVACSEGADSSFRATETGPLQVATVSGAVQGIEKVAEHGRVRAFLRIPYAAPPVGPRRFRDPEQPPPWQGVRFEPRSGPPCPQPNAILGTLLTGAEEDCLTVNVWTPSPPPDTPRPVIVALHGAAYVLGSNGDSALNAADLVADTGVVWVAVNSRMGPLGYLAHPALQTGEKGAGLGNYGLADQQEALRWVQDNIAAFGGDRERVTLLGHSGGAVNVCAHLFSPKSRNLFHRAILQSGSCFDLQTLEEAQANAETYASIVGCNQSGDAAADCLHEASPDALIAAMALHGMHESWSPVVDGELLPDHPRHIDHVARATRVPLIVGSTADEGVLLVTVLDELGFESWNGWLGPRQGYEIAVSLRFGAQAGKLLQQYPPSDTAPDARRKLAELLRDRAFACPARRLARLWSRSGGDAYLYVFERPLWNVPDSAFHTAEVPFLYNQPHPLGEVDDDDIDLVHHMRDYWTHFAARGEPGDAGELAWPRYTPQRDLHLQLDLPLGTESGYRSEQCDFWDTLYQEVDPQGEVR